jgi:hypothetical protein
MTLENVICLILMIIVPIGILTLCACFLSGVWCDCQRTYIIFRKDRKDNK